MKFNNEMKIGILVTGVLVILAWLTWKTGNFDFSLKGYEINVHFKDVDGVATNAPVTLNGLEVGRVKDITIVYGDVTRVELTLWIHAGVKIRRGIRGYVKSMGFLGEKYVALVAGNGEKSYLNAGDVIQGQETASFAALMSEGEDLIGHLKEASANINERLKVNSEAIDDIIANMRVSMQNIASISDNVNERLEVNDHLIDDFVVHVNAASRNFEEMSYDLKLNPWKLMYKPRQERKRGKRR